MTIYRIRIANVTRKVVCLRDNALQEAVVEVPGVRKLDFCTNGHD